MKNLRYIALAGNLLFIFWIVWNGIDEGPRSVGRLEAISLAGLLVLLMINFIILWKQK